MQKCHLFGDEVFETIIQWKQVGLFRASLIVCKWVLQLLGTVFSPLRTAEQSGVIYDAIKIQLTYLRWSSLTKWFLINLLLPECIPSGQFNCQLATTSQQVLCQRGIFNACDVQILSFAIMQHHRIDCVRGTVFHNMTDVSHGTQLLMRLNLGIIKLASSLSKGRADTAWSP